ncbi:MAG TPA: SRPBCC family protein [Candidatus Paceibacterota bacterium]|nr:SRPBCC family protein [Candidatus Paceibacterota bacterium]
MEKITVESVINAPVEKVWRDYTDPEAVKAWNAASDDWHTTQAANDLREGGSFLYRMEAKDGSAGFDFGGVYDAVVPKERIAYTMDDGRKVETLFASESDGTRITVSFDPETENTPELQRAGWQAILDNFKKYVEA